MSPPFSLQAYRYEPRSIACAGVRRTGRWRIKCTTIRLIDSGPVIADEQEPAWSLVEKLLGSVPEQGSDAGVGFLILHFGTAGVWLLLDWWEEDILRHRHFHAALSSPGAFRDVGPEHFGPCVWELAVQAHERRAWLEHVLANPHGPDLDAYLKDGLTGTI